jgi:hypothetical protein
LFFTIRFTISKTGNSEKLVSWQTKAPPFYLNIRKPDGSWTFARPAVSGNGRLKPLVAIVGKQEEKHPEAKYYFFWYEGERRRTKPIGQDPSLALTELQRHERKLEYLAAGAKSKTSPRESASPSAPRRTSGSNTRNSSSARTATA